MFNLNPPTPNKRIDVLLKNISNINLMYYGSLYLKPVYSRYGTISAHTQSIRECVENITYNRSMPNYKLNKYQSMYDWIDGADIVESITLWLTAVKTLNTALANTNNNINRHRILLELPDETLNIIKRLEDILEEVVL